MRIRSENDEGAGSAKPLRDLRILVADDEFFIAMDLETTLTDAGAEVVGPFSTAAEALRAVAGEPLSAAILDIRLGHDTTEAVADRLAQSGVPFLFYSGQGREMIRNHAHAPMLGKPSEPRAIVEALARLVGREPPLGVPAAPDPIEG